MRVRGIQSGFDFLAAAGRLRHRRDADPVRLEPDPTGRRSWSACSTRCAWRSIGIVLATVLGTLLGVGRFSRNALVRGLCYGYVELFRNIPVLLQLLMWYLLLHRRAAAVADARGTSPTCSS